MATQDLCCTLSPYFSVPDANLPAFRTLCEAFVERTRSEPKCLYYGFCFDGNQAHCREGYADAGGLLAHLEHVDDLLQQALQLAAITRLEVHGPAGELAKLRGPLAALQPQFFVLDYGFRR